MRKFYILILLPLLCACGDNSKKSPVDLFTAHQEFAATRDDDKGWSISTYDLF